MHSGHTAHSGENRPAVSARDGGQSAREAKPDDDGLGVDRLGVFLTVRADKELLEQEGSAEVADHDGPDVARMGAGAARRQHTEDAAEGDTVEGRAHEVVIQHDEQPQHAHIHQRRRRAVFLRIIHAVAAVLHQVPIVLWLAAHEQGKDDAQPEDDEAEDVAHAPGGDLQIGQRLEGVQLPAQDAVKHRTQKERGHADGDGGGVEVVALVQIRGVCQSRRQEEADDQSDAEGEEKPRPREARNLCVRIAQEQVGDQRRKSRGEDHRVDIRAEAFPLDKAVKRHAEEAEPDVQHVDAPKGEACREQKGDDRGGVRLCLREEEQGGTDQADKTCVQERACVAAVVKIVGRDLCRL